MDRASRPRVRVHGAPSRGILYTGPARRSRVLARRGERERHGKRCPLASIPRLVLRGRARARATERRNEQEREDTALSSRRLSVIALEGTPERRRILAHYIYT